MNMGEQLSDSQAELQLKEQFYSLQTREDIAALLGITDYQLKYYLYIHPREKLYKSFSIPKKSGETRVICTPILPVKMIQKNLNNILSAVYQPKASTHGFTKSKNIITNATQHLQQKRLLNLDLNSFFPSINFGRVRGLFLSPPYNCSEQVATVLAQICCYENELPQGAPTSPIISNMICAKLDGQLQRLAKKYRCVYTRYADDITISTSRAKFPSQIAWYSAADGKPLLGDELKQIIKDNDFSINESKTRLHSTYQRQEVTGVIVNERLNVRRKYIRQVRSMLYAWQEHGLENAQKEFFSKYDNKQRSEPRKLSFQHIVRSKIEFIGSVRGSDDHIYINFLRWLKRLAPELVNSEKLALIETKKAEIKAERYHLNATIWTEGKTDIKHLKAALRYMHNLGRFKDLQLNFADEVDDSNYGSTNLLKRCQLLADTVHTNPMIAIFDRDEPNILQKMHDDAKGFKDWKNGVYSFAIPVPSHRDDYKEICIEHYYKDEDIKRENSEGRRLFFYEEFDTRTMRHRINSSISISSKHNHKLKILDSDVFAPGRDGKIVNIAMSKNSFASWILEGEEIEGLEFDEFAEIFKTIEKILQLHSITFPKAKSI